MDRWSRMGLVSAAVAAVAGASVEGCVNGDIPAQQTTLPDAESGVPGPTSDGGPAASTGDEGGNGGSEGSGAQESDAGHADGGGSNAVGDAACGGLGQACCSAQADGCQMSLGCLGGATCSCAQETVGTYVLRVDGVVLAPEAATWIIDPETNAPFRPVDGIGDGLAHACAYGNGSVWCWQKTSTGNNNGELGNGTKGDTGTINRVTQVLTGPNMPLGGVASMAHYCSDFWSSTDASCAITDDGSLYCWGNLTWLTNAGTTLASAYAQQITADGLNPLAGVVQASIGEGQSACAVLHTGSGNEVHCWGRNSSYNLGQGDTILRQYPIKVAGLNNPSKVVIAADDNPGSEATACAIDGDQVRCWGFNGSNGDCGVNDTTTSFVMTPTLVKLQSGVALDGIVDLQGMGDPSDGNGGGGDFCALRNDGTIWCWGRFYHAYASNYGVTNVVSLGSVYNTPRYLTSDGVYHIGSQNTKPINCGTLQ